MIDRRVSVKLSDNSDDRAEFSRNRMSNTSNLALRYKPTVQGSPGPMVDVNLGQEELNNNQFN
jgi:hypothetical protein